MTSSTRGTRKESPTTKTTKEEGPGARNIPQQLVVPLNIGTWNGKAIVDTSASYTLIHASVWKALNRPNKDFKPWTSGPLFLANGETETPLGWAEVTIDLSHNACTLPVAILSPKALAYRVVLGLDSQPVVLTAQGYIDLAVANADVEEWEKASLRQLLESKPDLCCLTPGRTGVLQHHIHTNTEVPLRQKPYRMSGEKQRVIEQHLKEMLDGGIIEPSYSGWASTVIMVPKKDGGLRFCVDYRKLNAVTETDAYPLPNINELLESLAGCSVFTTLDLNSGYWQATMDASSIAKTAFLVFSTLKSCLLVLKTPLQVFND